MPLSTRFALPDDARLRAFEGEVRALVEAGHGARAVAVLREAAATNGHDDLVAATPATADVTVTGWDHVRRDVASVPCAVVSLRVVARSPSSPDADQGCLDRTLRGEDGGLAGLVPDDTRDLVRVVGLDRLLGLLRQPYDAPIDLRSRRDALGGWLVAALSVAAVGEACRRAPLPRRVGVEVGPHLTAHSREVGFDDLLPAFACLLRPPPDGAPDAAEQLRREREDDVRAAHQRTWADDVAQRREVHRLLRLVPSYRSRGRTSVAEEWELRLRMTCRAVGLEPVPEVGWRMSASELTTVLRRVLEAKQVPDVEAALDPGHTDALHARWVDLVGRGEVRPGAPTSVFELELLSLLHRGGPVARDRWERAGSYARELGR